jgi:hypothetical protein
VFAEVVKFVHTATDDLGLRVRQGQRGGAFLRPGAPDLLDSLGPHRDAGVPWVRWRNRESLGLLALQMVLCLPMSVVRRIYSTF